MADVVREIPGPLGPLEALIDSPNNAPRAIVVFAHPLPIEGGTMHTKVVFQSAKALARTGCAVLRFNFRGVGRSAGTWDEGRGEQDDYRTALDFAAARYPGLEIWAARFSFGSHVAMTVGAGDGRVCALIGIAPPVNKYDFGYLRDCEKPMLFLHGTQDEHGDVAKLEKVVENIRNAESVIVTGADHFFTKQLEAVEETMRSWAEELLET